MPSPHVIDSVLSVRDAGDGKGRSGLINGLAWVCLGWYLFILLVSTIGYVQLVRHYSRPPKPSSSSTSNSPHVSVIRPLKGLEPCLYQCLAATFQQDYPKERLTIYFCIADRNDPAVSVVQKLMQDFTGFDAHLLVEAEDPYLQDGARSSGLGPNPKIRNMSRAYREARGDICWIIDCNVWVSRGTCGRMVDKLQGRDSGVPQKFVHLLPLVIDTIGTSLPAESQHLLQDPSAYAEMEVVTTSTSSEQVRRSDQDTRTALRDGGGRLEETFMSSAHAKFYTAINTVLVAPCIVGKSTMFRPSHLNSLTDGVGIDYFSENICEDHLIGDLLWRGKVPEEMRGETWGKHGLVFGDLAIQPMAGMSVAEYVARRVRWLRVRKYTVTLATLVEPGTESFLCSLYGAFAVATLLSSNPITTSSSFWPIFVAFWLVSVSMWALIDWTLYIKLQSGASFETDEATPYFVQRPKTGSTRRALIWLSSWLGREALAFPVWAWAVFGGATVVWRGRSLWVGMDMKVHEVDQQSSSRSLGARTSNGSVSRSNSKARQD